MVRSALGGQEKKSSQDYFYEGIKSLGIDLNTVFKGCGGKEEFNEKTDVKYGSRSSPQAGSASSPRAGSTVRSATTTMAPRFSGLKFNYSTGK